MIYSNQSAARAYASVGLETDVASVEPAQLIVMLYDGALLSIARARQHMTERNIQKKASSISKAVQIIDEGLKASLEVRRGGDLARQLWQLYEYMCRRLLLASVNNDVSGLDEVTRLLTDLKDAWSQLAPAAVPVLGGNVVPLQSRFDKR